MRTIGLLVLIIVGFTLADPPPPYGMSVFLNDGTTESFWCSEIDPLAGITFDRLQMKVEQCIVDPATMTATRKSFFYCLSQVDSITFYPLAAPARAPKPAVIKPKR